MINGQKFYEMGEPVKLRWPEQSVGRYLLIVAVLAVVAFFISQLIGGFALAAVVGMEAARNPMGADGTPPLVAANLIATFLPIFFLIAYLLRYLEGRGLDTVGMALRGSVRSAVGEYLRGIVIGLLMLGGSVGLMYALGYAEVEAPFSGASIGGAFIVLCGWLVQGAGEEVLARGFLLQIFGRMKGTTFGIIASSLIFAGIHALNPGLTFLPIMNIFLFGVFFALFTLYKGNLWGVFAIHGIWNWAQGNLFGFQVSGNVVKNSIVLDLMETGPDVITGGEFGPEGGLAVTAILLIGMAVVVWRGKRKQV